MIRYYYDVDVFKISETWTPLKSRENQQLDTPRSQHGKFTVAIYLGNQMLAKAEGFTFLEARRKAYQQYADTPHGRNALRRQKDALVQFTNSVDAVPSQTNAIRTAPKPASK